MGGIRTWRGCMAALMMLTASPAMAGTERWSTDYVDGFGAVASIGGQVTAGDQFSIAVRGPACDSSVVFFTAYSHYKNSDFLQLQGKVLKVRFGDAVRPVRVGAARPFLMGHLAFLEVEGGALRDIAARYNRGKTIRAEVLDEAGAPNRFFDIPQNEWRTDGMAEALAEAGSQCKARLPAQAATAPAPSPAPDASCDQMVNGQRWAVAMKGVEQGAYLETLGRCLAGQSERQATTDALMVSVLNMLPQVATATQARPQQVADFVRDTLKVAAESGNPSSQHNFASLHNVDPKGPLASLYPVDEPTFLLWSRKAAAHREPRAMFNLAVRQIPDAATGYILLRHIRKDIDDGSIRDAFGPVLAEQTDKLRAVLGPDGTAEAEGRVAGFDFASLEPK